MSEGPELSERASRTAADRLVDAERVIADLRRRRPVLLTGSSGEAVLIAPAEALTDEELARVTHLAGERPHLLISPERAKVLKIRAYSDPVQVPLATDRTLAAARLLADPTLDLRDPLQGPFIASREPIAAVAKTALEALKLAEFLPAGIGRVLDGERAGPFGWPAWAGANRLAWTDASDVAEFHDLWAATLKPGEPAPLHQVTLAALPTEITTDLQVVAFRPDAPLIGGPDALALIVGQPTGSDAPLIRLHSECFTGDLLGSLKCDCGMQLRGALARMADIGRGVLLYLPQEGRGIGLTNKLRAYHLQDQGFDTVDANLRLGFRNDERSFAMAAAMLDRLNIGRVKLLTNNPDKMSDLTRHGIEVTERVGHSFPPNPHNRGYLQTKAEKTGHQIDSLND
ncbi:MAG: GTP cyclohydrolase II [Pseudomonadota bacterium]